MGFETQLPFLASGSMALCAGACICSALAVAGYNMYNQGKASPLATDPDAAAKSKEGAVVAEGDYVIEAVGTGSYKYLKAGTTCGDGNWKYVLAVDSTSKDPDACKWRLQKQGIAPGVYRVANVHRWTKCFSSNGTTHLGLSDQETCGSFEGNVVRMRATTDFAALEFGDWRFTPGKTAGSYKIENVGCSSEGGPTQPRYLSVDTNMPPNTRNSSITLTTKKKASDWVLSRA